MWFLISHIKETRNRNWANGLITIALEELKSDSSKYDWDWESMKWDSTYFKEQWEKDKSETNNHDLKAKWSSWEEARLAFFTKFEELKNNNKLKDGFSPTSYTGNWGSDGYLEEFLPVKTQAKK